MSPLRFSAACLAIVYTLLPALAFASALELRGPDGHIAVQLVPDAAGHLGYTITYKGRVVVEPSPLGLTVEGQDLGADVTLGAAKRFKTDESYPILGGHARAIDRSRGAVVPVTAGTARTPWTLEARVFNDGVAFRYRVPAAPDRPDAVRKIAGEATAWKLPAGGTIWYQDNLKRDYESPTRTALVADVAAQLKPGAALMSTALVRLGGEPLYLMMTEANLTGYSDMALAPGAPDTFAAFFHNSPEGWAQAGEIVSPWRVTLVAADLNTLVNTDVITNLCPPPSAALADADWVKPGRATWSWMISRAPKLPEQRKWIDWTRQLGFEDYIVDDGWIRWKAEGKDAWGCLKDVVDYATSQGVRIWAWTHSKELLTPEARAAYFQRAKAAGLVGLKIDFMKPADPWWVQWYDDTIRELADARLLVDFHGALKPTGRQRTWPNDLTREAIQGREARKRPGLHDTALPFTRFVQGPADYTPTDFRAEELRGNSYAHELAQAVVYTSPLFVYSGSPADYLASEAVELIQALPPVWDETRVLPGSEVGEVAAFARRRGAEWFIGVVNGATARTLSIAPGFLGAGEFALEQFADDATKPDGWVHTRRVLKAGDPITCELRADGGYVARLVPVRDKDADASGRRDPHGSTRTRRR
ncbi:MAG: hypothetical protein RIQ79_1614 [Verrucomicrobiota bacterium]